MSVALDPDDTIVAVATPAAAGLRGIVRLTGPAAMAIAFSGFSPSAARDLTVRRAHVSRGTLQIDGLRPLLPVTLAIWPAPRTYTGQHVVEIHLVGAVPLVNLVLAHCLGRGARHAEPGEFTLRAFLSGRIDLTRAEAVLGVIDAANPAQLAAALDQLAGGLSGPILAMRDHLVDVVAHLEANLDFTEEPDVDPLGREMLAAELDRSVATLDSLARRLTARESPDGYPRVVLVGPPNAGKSRLFNALVGRDCAIVSPRPGTTRDYVSALCRCDGVSVLLVDTAGIEAAADTIEKEAQALRVVESERASLLLVCRPAGTADVGIGTIDAGHSRLDVWTKIDLAPSTTDDPGKGLMTSAATGEGLNELRAAIAQALNSGQAEDDLPAGTGARCRGSLHRAQAALQSASETLRAGSGEELIAFDLRSAAEELGKVVGAVVTDDILDRIFRRFCIGK
jgi:tRNA modification GTPase